MHNAMSLSVRFTLLCSHAREPYAPDNLSQHLVRRNHEPCLPQRGPMAMKWNVLSACDPASGLRSLTKKIALIEVTGAAIATEVPSPTPVAITAGGPEKEVLKVTVYCPLAS